MPEEVEDAGGWGRMGRMGQCMGKFKARKRSRKGLKGRMGDWTREKNNALLEQGLSG